MYDATTNKQMNPFKANFSAEQASPGNHQTEMFSIKSFYINYQDKLSCGTIFGSMFEFKITDRLNLYA